MDKEVVRKLVFSMVQFLREQIDQSNLTQLEISEESQESIEVAIQCLELAFNVPQEESSNLTVSKPLYNIFHDGVEDDLMQSAPVITDENKSLAEIFKSEGNELMREGKYTDAIYCYTRAIEKDPTNAVYYCNRAAAHSKNNDHHSVIRDCELAIAKQPQYGKAYGRMGQAYLSLNNPVKSKECYQKALQLEPDNEGHKNNMMIAEEKAAQFSATTSNDQQNANPFAAAFGLSGLVEGSERVVPPIGSLLNNPALMNMATEIMSHPNMHNMFSRLLNEGAVPGGSSGASEGSEGVGGGGGSTSDGETGGSRGETGGGGLEALLMAGRQLAEQMEAERPDLVNQIRAQMNQGNTPGDANHKPPSQS